jgi:sterol desaturase/sphingolipid hydroxylase (fatty acid hydroxylase superfamily)
MSSLLVIALAAAVMALITLVERRLHRGRTDWLRNLQTWGIDLTFAAALLHYLPYWQGQTLLDSAALPFWIAFPVFFLVRDAAEFFYHYAQHRVPMLWAMHSLHHSDPEMTALTTNRHFWGDRFVKSLVVWPLTMMIITPSNAMIGLYAVLGLYNYFTHANIRVDFGRWSWVLNSPAYHRRHHSRLPEHFDTNFAALLPIFDVICGTYRRPDGWPPSGQDEAPGSISDLVFWPVRGAVRGLGARSEQSASP